MTDVLRLLEKHVGIFIWKNREIAQLDLRLGPRHPGFYPSSTLYCHFCLLETHLHSFTPKVIYSWLVFTQRVIFTEHKRTYGCYCTEDHSSPMNTFRTWNQSSCKPTPGTGWKLRLFQLPAGFDTYRYSPVPVMQPLVTPALVVPWHTTISWYEHWCAKSQMHSTLLAPVCSGLAAIFVNSFHVNLCTRSTASL